MAVFKRKPGGPYWVRFQVGCKDIFRSARTEDRGEAEEFEQALRNRYWRQEQLGEQVHTWGEAVLRLKRESRWAPNTRKANERSFKRFAKIAHVPLADIDKEAIAIARSLLLADDLAAASVNRHMTVFGQVLRAANVWGWLKELPAIAMESVPDRDSVFLTPDQCRSLALELPLHLRAPVLFSVLTGIRMANTRDLVWGRVHLDQGYVIVPSSSLKTRRNIAVPLEAPALAVLRSIPRTEGLDRVFTYQPFLKGGEGKRDVPRPIAGTFNTKAFRKARKRAGLAVRWHDLRHTFASWLAVAGASDQIITSLMGWTSPAMTKRYVHLRLGDTRSWASAACANAVAAVNAVVPEAIAKVQSVQEVKDMPSHRIELWTPSLRNSESPPTFQNNQALTGPGARPDTGRNGPSERDLCANPVARFPGPKRGAP